MQDLKQAARRVQEGGTERPLEGHSCGYAALPNLTPVTFF